MTCSGSCNQTKLNSGSCNPTKPDNCANSLSHNLSAETLEKTNRHPCYSFGAHQHYARMHLPVAPKCNISCNYCNRKFDCVNESRPGVTSEVLQPGAALLKFNLVKEQIDQLSVVGIAGPGDALANWENTKKSIELIQEKDPEVIFCLSTNGLLLPKYAQEIVDLGVNHVTVTLNCIDPTIGAKIYKHVNYQGQSYTGLAAAELLLRNQLAGIQYLTASGVMVKVNIVMIKGINDNHIPQVVQKAKELGVFITNIMPLIPAPGSAFENYPQTSNIELNQMRDLCQLDLQQMRHCKQCRADAIGLLGEDRSREFTLQNLLNNDQRSQEQEQRSQKQEQNVSGNSATDSSMSVSAEENRGQSKEIYQVAVASKYGKLIDQHFGYAAEFTIYRGDSNVFELVEKRLVECYCTGVTECDSEESKRDKLIATLQDCNAVLSMRIGYHAKQKLAKHGILSFESCDTVENGLADAFALLVNH